MLELLIFFFKQKTAYELRISDWSSDVCSSDLNIWKPTDFTGQAGDFPWGHYFDAAGVAGQAEYLVGKPSSFSGEAKAFAAAPLAVIKDYATLKVLSAYASYLSTPFDEADFAFYGTVL